MNACATRLSHDIKAGQGRLSLTIRRNPSAGIMRGRHYRDWFLRREDPMLTTMAVDCRETVSEELLCHVGAIQKDMAFSMPFHLRVDGQSHYIPGRKATSRIVVL